MTRFASNGRRAGTSRVAALAALTLFALATAGSPAPPPGSRLREVCGLDESAMRQEIRAWYAAHPAHGASAQATIAADTFLVSNFRFDTDGTAATPVDSVHITAGQNVLIKWVAGFHTVTSGNPTDLDAGSLFDHAIDNTLPENLEVMLTFNTPGTYPLFCRPHGQFFNMRGFVIVAPNTNAVPGAETPRASGLSGSPWPNPVRDGTTFRFALARAGRASAGVFDAAGREVAPLFDRDWTAGTWSASWDGRVDGRRAAPGVYFLRLRTADGVTSRRLSVVR